MSEFQLSTETLHDLRRRLKLARERFSDLAWELEELELRLKALQSQQQEGGATDTLVGREVEQLLRRRSEQEELILRQMLEIDEIEANVAQLHADADQRYDERGAAL